VHRRLLEHQRRPPPRPPFRRPVRLQRPFPPHCRLQSRRLRHRFPLCHHVPRPRPRIRRSSHPFQCHPFRCRPSRSKASRQRLGPSAPRPSSMSNASRRRREDQERRAGAGWRAWC